MSGGWQLRSQSSYVDDGNALSNSAGLLFPDPPQGVYSPFQQLIAAVPFNCSGIDISLMDIGFERYGVFDLAIGPAGAEQVIASAIGYEGNYIARRIRLPLQVPAGTRVSGRNELRYLNNTGGLYVCTEMWTSDFYSGRSYQNFAILSDAVVISPSASPNVKGPWYTLNAAISQDVAELTVIVNNNNAHSPQGEGLLDIGVGPAGAEIAIIPNLMYVISTGCTPPSIPWYQTVIPAGTRIAARMQSTSGDGLGVSTYGVS